jgi:uncharacterized protein YdaU (DUF1376 family)
MTRRIPPSWDFFPDDFVGGTVHLAPVAVGVYVRLLCWQWSAGSIPDSEPHLLRIAGCTPDEWAAAWPDLVEKFPVGPDGKRRNPRLERERDKKLAICSKRADAARKGRAAATLESNCSTNAVANAEHLPSKREEGSRKTEDGSGNPEAGHRKPDAGATQGRRKTMPTSVDEVANWCVANEVRIDAGAFFHYYQSQGWKKGNGRPVADWHAAARAWESRQTTIATSAPRSTPALFEQQRRDLTQTAFDEVFHGR